ncbi:molecular chaperone TorD family protein [Bacillus sp. REN3]|uniref:molecular chaperone TorD family protein n=1 Tax=Bacillus sp. REN3 TaxID=2802440 RepID=UPI001FF07633|nr:molecular chaperone TorD family protein [Bacillus sp. REN3]
MEERYGKLAIANLLTSIWFGDWKRYEEIMEDVPEPLQQELSFHSFYKRDEVQLWHDNHFFIPGDHFVSPYFSSYPTNSGDEEDRRKDLLCLIGLYEKTGFYYPLEQDRFPDHFGSLTAFLSSVMKEEIEAEQEGDSQYLEQLEELEADVLHQYIQPVIRPLLQQAEMKVKHPFFKEFLRFYADMMENGWVEAAE